jgi:hypothetical protein
MFVTMLLRADIVKIFSFIHLAPYIILNKVGVYMLTLFASETILVHWKNYI